MRVIGIGMWLKTLYYFGLLILPTIILGQNLNSIISNGIEKDIVANSQLMECYSGPIVWSNCQEKGALGKFPTVSQL